MHAGIVKLVLSCSGLFSVRSLFYLAVIYVLSSLQERAGCFIVGEPKSRIVQKHTIFAPERYTAEIL